MKKNLYILMAIVGLTAFFTACEEDGTRVVMSENPVAPSIVSVPDLTLVRSQANDTLVFRGTPVDPGFTASANYFLEACPAGTGFSQVTQVWSGVDDSEIKITVGNLNGALKKNFPTDQVSTIDFRLRAVLVVDAGTGSPGTSTSPFEYASAPVTADVTVYGLPRLDLVNSGKIQKVESALGDGNYSGIVKMSVASPFTLSDPDSGTQYGGAAGVLSVDGPAIVPPADGYHILDVSVPDMTYEFEAMMIGLVGSATPNAWDSPDQKMEYDQNAGTWSITLELIVGEYKFRLNDGWAWNLGGTPDNLFHDGPNLAISEAGNYTITLTITDFEGELATCTIVKN
ncbi:MAG: SusE domain-containing protein [Bacteroidales bacterium]|nr:SusE domain-containing protein [Bacteroidales bacterium]